MHQKHPPAKIAVLSRGSVAGLAVFWALACPARTARSVSSASTRMSRISMDQSSQELPQDMIPRAITEKSRVRQAGRDRRNGLSRAGLAVQSHLIHQRIRQLAEENARPVVAFVEDVAASGGYMIACAADEIVCDTSSIVGSIGVVGGTFGFDKLIEKLGIERRLYTSGERKAMLDPFLPQKEEDVARLKAIQREIHEGFIALVKGRRGAALTGPETDLFSGEYWTGNKALEFGLIDRIGDLRSTLRQ